MPVPKELSLPIYLRQHNIRYDENSEYEVSASVELVCFQAHHLAEMQAQPLHALHMLKAILHTPGSPAEKLMLQQGLTLEKIHNTPLNPNDLPLQCDRLFGAVIRYARKSPVIGVEHLLLALLEQEVLRPYFVLWHIELDAFYKNVWVQAG